MKDKLKVLLERNYGLMSLPTKIQNLLQLDEGQLLNSLYIGVKISNELNLQYLPGVGFRCWNTNQNAVGVLPVAGLIERKLNYELSNMNLSIKS